MPTSSPNLQSEKLSVSADAVFQAIAAGLTSTPKSLPAWLLYDAAGSALFEKITELPEYYLTRTETALLATYAETIVSMVARGSGMSIAELGAGTAKKTSLLLDAASRLSGRIQYQPIDVSTAALEIACNNLNQTHPMIRVFPDHSNYVTDPLIIHPDAADAGSVLAVYIGSSIGNFSSTEAERILRKLSSVLNDGQWLLLGTDLAPGPNKSIEDLLDAYDDSAGVTAEFNLNLLHRMNRESAANFESSLFRHVARWNASQSSIEMHLEATTDCSASFVCTKPGEKTDRRVVHFRKGETIHTESSHKFEISRLDQMLLAAGFRCRKRFCDTKTRYALTLAQVVTAYDHPDQA